MRGRFRSEGTLARLAVDADLSGEIGSVRAEGFATLLPPKWGGEALRLADELRGSVGGFKIGNQLFTGEGPVIVRTLAAKGDRVFLDLKYYDIPNTVAAATARATATLCC